MKRVGEKADLFLTHKATLPASLTTLYGLTKLNDSQLAEKIQTDLRGVTRIKVEKLVGVKSAMCPLISFRIAADVSDDMKIEILDDFKDAARALSESYKTPIEVSSSKSQSLPT